MKEKLAEASCSLGALSAPLHSPSARFRQHSRDQWSGFSRFNGNPSAAALHVRGGQGRSRARYCPRVVARGVYPASRLYVFQYW